MPTVLTALPEPAPVTDPPRKRWTRPECVVLEDWGLWDQQKLELVEGELISKPGKQRPHTNVSTLVNAWLVEVFGVDFVNFAAPIDVAPQDNPFNEPEPDLIVLGRPSAEIQIENPQPHDVRLVVEISDTTARFDLGTKAALYARAGIAEYWVVDIAARQIVVHRNPEGGRYAFIAAYARTESVCPLAARDAVFPVNQAFEPFGEKK